MFKVRMIFFKIKPFSDFIRKGYNLPDLGQKIAKAYNLHDLDKSGY